MKTSYLLSVVLIVVLGACGGGIGDAQTRLRTAIEARQDNLDGCYGDTLEHMPAAAGKIGLLIHVKQGQVSDVDVTATEIEDVKLVKCVKSTLKKVALDPPPKSDFEVEYTLRFKVGDS
jgi:hypothetical protein